MNTVNRSIAVGVLALVCVFPGWQEPARAASDKTEKTLAGGAVGAAGGALVGAIAGNAAIGAAVGGGVGLLVGHMKGKEAEEKKQQGK